MNDEFDRLMATPRLCRCCGKKCGGLRCRSCYSFEGRLLKAVGSYGKDGVSEEELVKIMTVEGHLRSGEREGKLHEVQGKWATGKHPEQVSLWAAFESRVLSREMAEVAK